MHPFYDTRALLLRHPGEGRLRSSATPGVAVSSHSSR